MTKNEALIEYLLRLGDDSLILGQRCAEWCGHGPYLEEDIALSNIGLDLFGQTNFFYSLASQLEGKGRTEDDFAYLRLENEYRNNLLCELPNGDYAQTMLRLYFISSYQYLLYKSLQTCAEKSVADIAQKVLKETTYHVKHSKDWVVRFGNGTSESRERLQAALRELWMYVGDLFSTNEANEFLLKEKIVPSMNNIKQEWFKMTEQLFVEISFEIPKSAYSRTGARDGFHTEYMGFILSELQYLQRTYPGCKW